MRIPLPGVQQDPVRQEPARAPQTQPVRDFTGETISGIGDAMQRAGTGMFRVGEHVQAQINDAKLREGLNRLSDVEREVLLGEGGYFTKVGKDAVEGREAAVEALTKRRQEIEQGFENESQKKAFREASAPVMSQRFDQIAAHHAEAARVQDLAETETLANTRLQQAFDSFFIPGANARATFQNTLSDALGEVEQYAKKRGLGPNATADAMQKASDAVYTQITKKLISNGHSDTATEWLKTVNMSSPARAALEDDLKRSTIRERGERAAEVFSGYGSLREQLDALQDAWKDGLVSIEVRDSAYDSLVKRDRVAAGIQAEEKVAAWDDAVSAAELNRGEISQDQEDKLKATGQLGRFLMAKSRGEFYRTDDTGWQAVMSASGEALAKQFDTDAKLIEHYGPHTTREHLQDLRKRRFDAMNPKAPKVDLDESSILARELRDALGLPDDAKILPGQMDRWSAGVRGELFAVLTAEQRSEPTPADWHTAAMNLRKRVVFFTQDLKAGIPSVLVSEKQIRESTTYQPLPGGKWREIPLTDQSQNLSSREQAELEIADIGRRSDSEQRAALGGKTVRELTEKDRADYENAVIESRRERNLSDGTEFVRRLYRSALQDTVTERIAASRARFQVAPTDRLPPLTLPNPFGSPTPAITAEDPYPDAHLEAVKRVLDRHEEWDGFHMTADEVRAAIAPLRPSRADQTTLYQQVWDSQQVPWERGKTNADAFKVPTPQEALARELARKKADEEAFRARMQREQQNRKR